MRAVSVAGRLLERRLRHAGKGDSTAMIRLLQRAINATAFCFAAILLLGSAGNNVTAVLAGLGVGGIAIAFAAQKTLENLFGGVSIIFDKPIRVGDLCRIGDAEGWVEDIGLRSTRFRTWARTILTVPNGRLSVMNLENLGMREKILFRHVVGVRGTASRQQVEKLLAAFRAYLGANAMVESATVRVRLIRVAPPSLNIEVFAYVLTTELVRFLEVQEELCCGFSAW